MTSIEQLHTVVRRYCIDNHRKWSLIYRELLAAGNDRIGNLYTEDALATFPRYNVLNAILVEIERHRPTDFSDFQEANYIFKLAARSAESVFTERPIGKIDAAAMNEEREQLAAFIDRQSPETVQSVEPLFYRRVLSKEERINFQRDLETRWRVTKDYWYPLCDYRPADVEAFKDSYFDAEVGEARIRSLLGNRQVQRVFVIGEGEADYEIELSILEPCYTGVESFWFDTKLGWIIYASHESSVTIGGWLLDDVKAVWPHWEERLWTSPFFDHPN